MVASTQDNKQTHHNNLSEQNSTEKHNQSKPRQYTQENTVGKQVKDKRVKKHARLPKNMPDR